MKRQDEEQELLNARQTADLTTLSTQTLHAYAAAREAGLSTEGPPHVRLGKGSRRWLRKDVLAWLESCRVGGPVDGKARS